MKSVSYDDLKWYGRFADIDALRYFDFSASGFEFCFTGKKAVADILSDPQNFDGNTKGVIGVYVTELKNAADYQGSSFWEHFSDELSERFILTETENKCVLFESDCEKTVLIRVLKLSEVNFGCAALKSLEIDGVLEKPALKITKKPLRLEIVGDSITCGYGIEGVWEKDPFTTKQERADLAYGFLTAKKLGAEFNLVSWSGIGIISKYVDESIPNPEPDTTVVMPSVWNYTDKSLALRLGREPDVWDVTRFEPDVVVIHLGTNDASYVRTDGARRKLFVSGYRQFLEAVHRRSPSAKICCCLGVMGQVLCDAVEEAVTMFAKDFPAAVVKSIRFPMQDEKTDGVAADWHPSAKSHQKMAGLLADALGEWC